MTEMLLGQSSPRWLDPLGGATAGAGPGGVDGAIALVGLGTSRIAGAVGCSRNTVKRYLAAHGWVAIRQPSRRGRLDGLHDWLAEGFRRHRGSCDVVRQDLLREHAIKVSLPRWSVRSRRGAKRCGPRREPACVSRDAAWQAAADRLWADHGADWGYRGAGTSVCRDLGLFAAAVCPGLPA